MEAKLHSSHLKGFSPVINQEGLYILITKLENEELNLLLTIEKTFFP